MEQKRIPLTVERIEPLGKNKYKVKLRAETEIINMKHEGRHYVVMKSLGRGRYIMRGLP